MHDGVRLETLNRPTPVVVITELLHEAEVQRAALGMGALEPAVIQHPLSRLTDAEIAKRAADAGTEGGQDLARPLGLKPMRLSAANGRTALESALVAMPVVVVQPADPRGTARRRGPQGRR